MQADKVDNGEMVYSPVAVQMGGRVSVTSSSLHRGSLRVCAHDMRETPMSIPVQRLRTITRNEYVSFAWWYVETIMGGDTIRTLPPPFSLFFSAMAKASANLPS